MARRNRRRRTGGRMSSRRRSSGRRYSRKPKFLKWVLWILIIGVVGLLAVAMFAKNPPKWVPKFLLKLRKDNGLREQLLGGNQPSDATVKPLATVTTTL